MLFLIIAIVLNAFIFALFKWFGLRQINTFHAIVANYFVCVLTGTLFTGPQQVLNQPADSQWLYIALVLGGIFISVFYLMALTAQRISMAAASIASKMAFAIPVLFSIYVLQVETRFVWYNYIGIALALAATYMSAVGHDSNGREVNLRYWLLPVLVFLGNGLIDSTINFTNLHYLDQSTAAVFPVYIFLSAAVIGGIILLVKGERPNRQSLQAGLVLGVVNYFTVYTFLMALEHYDNNGALVFPVFNTGIVALSSLTGIFFFHEKLTPVNKAGIGVAIVAIYLVMS